MPILNSKSSEFKRWLAAQGTTFSPARLAPESGIDGRISYLPMHSKELGTGLVATIKSCWAEIGGYMRYRPNFQPDGKFFLVTFPIFPRQSRRVTI